MIREFDAKSLAGKAYGLIEERIVTLQMKPGQLFTEMELVESLQIGRTPVREALLSLKRHGLVRVLPRKGMLVTDVNIGEFLLMLETRRALEALMVEKACSRAKPIHLEALQTIAHEMKSAAQKKDVTSFMRCDAEFDLVLSEAARNPYVAAALDPLHAHSRRMWYYAGEPGQLDRPAELHILMMEAICTSRPGDATKALNQLLDFVQSLARTYIEL